MSIVLRFFLCCKNDKDEPVDKEQSNQDQPTKADTGGVNNKVRSIDQLPISHDDQNSPKAVSFMDMNSVAVIGGGKQIQMPEESTTAQESTQKKGEEIVEESPIGTSNRLASESGVISHSIIQLHPGYDTNRGSTATFFHENSSSNADHTLDLSKGKTEEEGKDRSKLLKSGVVLKKLGRRNEATSPGLSDKNLFELSHGAKQHSKREVLNSTPIMRSSTLKK